jgi:opacity protein-like surface antigen
LNYGGFQSDCKSWQALVTAHFAINDNWSLVGGYRYLDISHDFSENSFDFSQSGPVFGATYCF